MRLSSQLDFMPISSSAGTEVEIEAKVLDDTYELRVMDRGPGIDEKERVFERFVQGGDLLTDKPSGVGLGLPICREIARGFGGSIVCEDSPGGGATFVLSLPRAR